MRAYIWHSIFITIAAAVLLTTICALLCPAILHILTTPANIYKDAYIYLLIIFLRIPCTLFEHTSCRWRQQNTFFVFGVFRHTKYYLGSGLHRCLSLGLCRCCNCNDHRSGDQRAALSRVYTKEGTDTAVLGSLLRSTSYRLVCLLCAQLKKRKEYK